MRLAGEDHDPYWEIRRKMAMKTKGEIEAEISDAMVKFEVDYMGRGPKFDPNRTFLPAGQGAGMIDRIKPAKEIFEDIVREAETILNEMFRVGAAAPSGVSS